MIRNPSIAFLISVVAMICGSHIDVGAKSSKDSKPNIVLIISDDQDYEHFGFMGNKTVRTLNLDKLAAAGTVFNICHLTSSRCRCLLYTSPSPRDRTRSRMPSSA